MKPEKFVNFFFCKVAGEGKEEHCGHEECSSDPDYRTDDDVLIDIATTCSNRWIALSAEMALRRRYPSKKARKHLNCKGKL